MGNDDNMDQYIQHILRSPIKNRAVSAVVENVRAASNFNSIVHPIKLQPRISKVYVKWVFERLHELVNYRIKRLKYTKSDIMTAKVFDISLIEAKALGKDITGDAYRKIKKGNLNRA